MRPRRYLSFGDGSIVRATLIGILTISSNACGPHGKTSDQSRPASMPLPSELTQDKAILAEHGEAERPRLAEYLHMATASVDDLRQSKHRLAKHAWPIALLSIGHSNASYQNYSGDPYFHHGLDMRGDAGDDVFASAGGKVVNIENYVPGNPAYWEVAILDDDGFLWQYHHIDRQSIPQQIVAAHRSGGKITAGTKIGEIYYWPATAFGERFHHIHLNILGHGGVFVSPFLFLEDLPDTQAPDVIEVGVLKNGQRWTGGSVSGAYSLYATVHDLVLHHKFIVPPHSLSYRLDGNDEVLVWNFNTLPGGSSEKKYVHDYFVRSLTCGNYNCRKLVVNLGFSVQGARNFPLNPGQHTVEVIARDFAGNETTKSYSWRVE